MLYLEKDWSAVNIIVKSEILFGINGAFTDKQTISPSQVLVFELWEVQGCFLVIDYSAHRKGDPLMSDHLKCTRDPEEVAPLSQSCMHFFLSVVKFYFGTALKLEVFVFCHRPG